MFTCDYKDGQWVNPTIQPYGDLTISPAAKVFHYGQAIFEGMKAFKDDTGKVFMFRPDQNIKRFNKSAIRLAIPECPEDLCLHALNGLIKRDGDWVQPGLGNAFNVRPLATVDKRG